MLCQAIFQVLFLAVQVSTVRSLNQLATTCAPLQHGLVLPPSTPPPPVLFSTPLISPTSAAPLEFLLLDSLYLVFPDSYWGF